MRLGRILTTGFGVMLAATGLAAQSPVLSSIQTPNAPLQNAVHVGGQAWGPGIAAYGPVGTPLILNGSNFGDSGAGVYFVGYTDGMPDPGHIVLAEVSNWTNTQISLTIPIDATSGLVFVDTTTGFRLSNPLPVIVMPGLYAGASCSVSPARSPLRIVTSSLNNGTANQPYSTTLNATGGTQAYTWSIAAGTLPSGLTLDASTGVISGTPTAGYGPADLLVRAADSSSPQQTATATLSLDITTLAPTAFSYSYCISSTPSANCSLPSGGYDAVGNVMSYYDSVTGTWSMSGGYDSLNRLTGAQATAGAAYNGLQVSWSYDSFGNRTAEGFSGNDQGYAPVPPSTSADYNANNQVQSVGSGTVPTYDAAGDALTDMQNQQYLYDAEGRICAVNALGGMVGYLYDAEGTRIAKGTITSLSCDTSSNGFQLTTSYILGSSNEQLTELSWSGGTAQWVHTNVWAAGQLLATYSPNSNLSQQPPGVLYFHLSDWLGTRRVTTDYTGTPCMTYTGLPYGNSLMPSNSPCASPSQDSTEHHFTGKIRDSETGNDYFGARYYASTMGRFLSPDDGSDQNPFSPQSWNLYAYGRNNPLIGVDEDGHQYTVCDKNGQNCSHMDDPTFEGDETKDQHNGEYFQGGVMFHKDADGNNVTDGYFHWDGPDAALTPEQFGQIGNQGMGAINWFGRQMLINAATDGLLGLGFKAFEASPLATQIGRNALKGSAGEATVNAMLRLRGYKVVGGQVTVRTTAGIRYVDYIVEKGGEYFAIEVKTGDAVRNASQLTKDGLMESAGGTIGNNGGILQGQTLKLKTIEMRPF